MDSGQGYEKMNARDLTAEIDRATDEVAEAMDSRENGNVPAESGEQNFVEFQGNTGRNVEISDAQAQNLGHGAILSGAERNEIAAEVMVSRAENAVENPEEFVGEETDEQRREYALEDRQAVDEESGRKGSLSEEVGSANLKKVTQHVKDKVGAMVREPSYELRGLTGLYREGNRLGVSAEEEGREIGDRN